MASKQELRAGMEWKQGEDAQYPAALDSSKEQNLYVQGDHTHMVWKVTVGCYRALRILDDDLTEIKYRSKTFEFSKLKQAKRWCERDWRNGSWLEARVMVDVAGVVDG
jgi:hypothetical protein